MADSIPIDLSSELRDLGSEMERLIRKTESVLQDAAWPHPPAETDLIRRLLHLSLRDLASAQQAFFRATLADSDVMKRLLVGVLGRPLGQGDTFGGAEDHGSIALDPFRTHLVESAMDIDRLAKMLGLIRVAMSDGEVEPEARQPTGDESVIDLANVLVDRALRALEEGSRLLYSAAELKAGRSEHLQVERAPGLESRAKSGTGCPS